ITDRARATFDAGRDVLVPPRSAIASAAAIACAALGASACSVDDIGYEGRACSAEQPCSSGYACVDGRCRLAATSSSTGPSCTALFTVADFRYDWATPNVIRWGWTPPGDSSNFREYKLLTAKTQDDLENALKRATDDSLGPGSGSDRVWTKADNDEL